MSNSSRQQNSSKTSIDDLFTTIGATGSDTFTITLPPDVYTSTYIDSSMNVASDGNVYTISSGGGGTYTSIGGDTITLNTDYQFSWGDAEEFIDSFPDWQRIQDMCKKYPGLEIALRNFQTVYTLVKDDYDNPKDKE